MATFLLASDPPFFQHARMIENLIAYEMAGQRRCIHALAGYKHMVGGGEQCHVRLSGDDVPDVLFSFVRDGAGGIQLLDQLDEPLQDTTMPLKLDVLGIPVVMFEPRDLLEAPFAVNATPTHGLVMRCGEESAPLQVPPGQLLCAGCAADADIVLPDGPNYAYALWWDGAQHLYIAVLDSSEGGAWLAGGVWGQQEVVELPVVLNAGPQLCELKVSEEANLPAVELSAQETPPEAREETSAGEEGAPPSSEESEIPVRRMTPPPLPT
jgi:hypothetical protein